MISDQSNVHFNFRSLAYMEKLVGKLIDLNWEEHDMSSTLKYLLYQSNFNHLTFFKYLQNDVSVNAEGLSGEFLIDYLQMRDAEFMSIPLEYDCNYDSSWPSIKEMMAIWLKEQIKLAVAGLKKEPRITKGLFAGKLGLKMSVAFIACLIKLFYEEELFATENLTSIFKFYAANYESKRQSIISSESLSKEYYSVDSHTALHIKKMLQRMIDNLNRGFFPVVVATSISIGVYSGIL